MQKLSDFHLSEEEIRQIYGSREDYEDDLAWYADKPVGYTAEKIKIARVLFLRGKREECRELLETIEDDRVRKNSLQEYASWFAKDGEIIN